MSKPLGKKYGRPPIAASKRRSSLIAVRLRPVEVDRLEADADALGVTLSELIRRRILGKQQEK